MRDIGFRAISGDINWDITSRNTVINTQISTHFLLSFAYKIKHLQKACKLTILFGHKTQRLLSNNNSVVVTVRRVRWEQLEEGQQEQHDDILSSTTASSLLVS